MAIRWGSYKVKGIYDELIRAANKPRDAAKPLCDYLRALNDKEIEDYKEVLEAEYGAINIDLEDGTYTEIKEDVKGNKEN